MTLQAFFAEYVQYRVDVMAKSKSRHLNSQFGGINSYIDIDTY